MFNQIQNKKAFTLLEVVIALALLSFLSFFTAQSIQKSMQAKRKIQDQIDRQVELREAIDLMVRDIQLAFNYRDPNIELYNAAVDVVNATPTPTVTVTPTPTPTPTPPPDTKTLQKKTAVTVTQFIGDETNLDFSSLSFIRSSADEVASDQAEIGYSLENCRSRGNSNQSSKCLWRRVSPFIDEDIKDGGTKTVILENVERLSFRYKGPEATEEWIRSWSSAGDSSDANKGQFPYAVEISLEVKDDRTDPPKTLGMSAVAQLRFPNNPPKKEADSSGK